MPCFPPLSCYCLWWWGSIKKLPTGLHHTKVKGRLLEIRDKREEISRGIWKIPEQRENRLDMFQARTMKMVEVTERQRRVSQREMGG